MTEDSRIYGDLRDEARAVPAEDFNQDVYIAIEGRQAKPTDLELMGGKLALLWLIKDRPIPKKFVTRKSIQITKVRESSHNPGMFEASLMEMQSPEAKPTGLHCLMAPDGKLYRFPLGEDGVPIPQMIGFLELKTKEKPTSS